jgi:hypothetical protein
MRGENTFKKNVFNNTSNYESPPSPQAFSAALILGWWFSVTVVAFTTAYDKNVKKKHKYRSYYRKN